MDIIHSSLTVNQTRDKSSNYPQPQEQPNNENNLHRRSKSSGDHQNLLIDAASRIFSSITQLKHTPHYHDINKLREYLLTEISHFKEHAEKFDYNEDLVLIGQYAVSATLDETICKTSWGNKANWGKCNLLQELQENINADEHFFAILDKICQKPLLFIDAIELMYICINLGFEGKYKHHPLEKQRLQQVCDDTYEVIRAYRGEFEKKLTPKDPSTTKKQNRKKKHFNIPIISIIVLSSMIIVGMYFGFNYLLKISAKQATQQLQTLIKESS